MKSLVLAVVSIGMGKSFDVFDELRNLYFFNESFEVDMYVSTILMERVKSCGFVLESKWGKLNYLVFTCHKSGNLRRSKERIG